MKSKPPAYFILISSALSAGCTSIAPSATVSETVIESLLPTTQPEKPWRLDCAWQGGGLAGSALRASSIEHVVRQVYNKHPVSTPVLHLTPMEQGNANTEAANGVHRNDAETIERAWRKYCHHQLDMTAEDHALIEQTSIPRTVLKHGCNPNSLLK